MGFFQAGSQAQRPQVPDILQEQVEPERTGQDPVVTGKLEFLTEAESSFDVHHYQI